MYSQIDIGKISQNSGKFRQIKKCLQYRRIHPSALSLSRALDGWRPDWEWQLGSLLSLRGNCSSPYYPHTLAKKKAKKGDTRKEKETEHMCKDEKHGLSVNIDNKNTFAPQTAT